ncbi:MAG: LysR family transcriptional regulator [Alphaproteobacteria bacterium]|nr:LysR family transcriptional regulator [Alphaproteobacteria bacterium]
MALDRFETLTVFLAVAKADSFAAAATQLGLSRAMVSKHIQALERRLGVRLMNRTTRRLALTDAGRSLRARVERILADLEAAEGEVASGSNEPRGLLRLSAPVSFGARHVAPALAEFLASHRELRADLVLDDRIVDLVAEGFDLAVRVGRLQDSSLMARRLAPCRLAVVAAPDYLAARGTPHQPSDLAGHDCLGYAYAAERGVWRFVGPGGAVETVNVDGTLRANNGDALMQAAIAGSGIALLPTFICGEEIRRGRVVCVLEGWAPSEIAVNAVHPHTRHVPAKVRRFIEFLAGRFGSTPPWDDWMVETPRRRPPARAR